METHFTNGNMADVVRVGDSVRKSKGTWWQATRQVLDHLDARDFPWSPRYIRDSENEVILSYIDGHTIPANLEMAQDPALLAMVAKCTRQFHDTVEGFRLTNNTGTVVWPHQPSGDSILCHNDLSPWNTVVLNGKFAGFIDWDLVSYGSREWELAWMCWRWAPLYPTGERTHFTVEEQADRCLQLITAYGSDCLDLHAFVDLIAIRMKSAVDVVEILGAQGVPGFDRILATGMHLSGIDDYHWLMKHAETFRTALEP